MTFEEWLDKHHPHWHHRNVDFERMIWNGAIAAQREADAQLVEMNVGVLVSAKDAESLARAIRAGEE